MNNLIVMLDIKIKYAKSHPEHAKQYFEQAFGMVEYHTYLFPNDFDKVEKLWNEVYRPQFEKIVFGY